MEKCELDVGKVDTNSMCCLHAGRYPAGGLVWAQFLLPGLLHSHAASNNSCTRPSPANSSS